MPACVPVPLSGTFCGLLGASSANVRDAVRLPVADGEKVTLTLQVALTATVAPVQLLALTLKSPALLPPSVTLVMCRLADPVLVMVIVWAALVEPTPWLLKLRLPGLKLIPGVGTVPVPPSATLCGLAGALSVNDSEALRLPAAPGVKVRLTLHVPPGPSEAPVQVSAVIAKSALLVPTSATAVR